jgi:CRP-like cAMP-binding protein
MHVPPLSSQDQALQAQWLARKTVTPQQLEQALAQRSQAWEQALESLRGQQAEISFTSGSLCLRDFPDEKLLFSLPLEVPLTTRPPECWGRELIVLNPADGRLLKLRTLPENWQPHLLIPRQGQVCLGLRHAQEKLLFGTVQSLDIHRAVASDFSPCDLLLSPARNVLLVSDRKAGLVIVFSLLTGARLGQVRVRPVGSTQAIGLAIDPSGRQAVLTDQQSTCLHLLDLGSCRLHSLDPGLGVPGNLVFAPHPRYLFVYVLKPDVRLVLLDLDTFTVMQTLPLKGEAFSLRGEMPLDLMHLTPDGNWLAVLTAVPESDGTWTPCVHVIDPLRTVLLRRFMLRPGTRPAGIVTGFPSPLQTVVECGLRDWLPAGSGQPQAAVSAPVVEPPAPVVAAAPLSLSVETERLIEHLLVQGFERQTGISLSAHPSEIRRLRRFIPELRMALEQQAVVQVEIPDISGQHVLKMSLTRDDLALAVVTRGRTQARQAAPPALELLRLVPFLTQAPPELLQALAEKLRPLRVEAGTWVLREGQEGDRLYFIVEGEVEVRREGLPQPLATLSVGDLFGEMALVLSEPRSAGIRALTRTELLQLERQDFKAVSARFPLLARELRVLAHKRKLLLQQLRTFRKDDTLTRMKARMAVLKLREIAWLSGAEDAFFEDLSRVLRPVSYPPGQEIFRQGDPSQALYFISRGSVGVWLGPEAGPGAPAFELGAGEVFGEMGLLLEEPRSASVKALSYCQLYELARGAFEHVCRQYPRFSQKLELLARERLQFNQQPTPVREWPAPLPPPLPVTTERRAWLVFDPHQAALQALDPELKPLGAAWPELNLFEPFRVSSDGQRAWVADTGHNRVLELDLSARRILHEWGDHRLELLHPRSLVRTPEGFYLIADEGHQRLVAVDPDGRMVWEYTTPHEILSPFYAEMTPTGTLLFADAALHQVLEITRSGELIWAFGSLLIAGSEPDQLCEPMFAHRLPDGQTLIADSGNQRLLWVNPAGEPVRTQVLAQKPVHCERGPEDSWLVLSEDGSWLRF